jgi:hypothetical protein
VAGTIDNITMAQIKKHNRLDICKKRSPELKIYFVLKPESRHYGREKSTLNPLSLDPLSIATPHLFHFRPAGNQKYSGPKITVLPHFSFILYPLEL